ncbi:hypothetical protein J6524_00770 [Bradyrhizobium sp. WSM 1738]|uniref:aconitase family protein n=1 Tax=Bradyrhizobium hereditatis TaxID=2821405 RepID=UPI001CE386BB|nr:aconitase family protein [Bradyrhizobium hereditatis]MCA6113464.1 hypothetical protein [Bradyrhizobium hereditatis]
MAGHRPSLMAARTTSIIVWRTSRNALVCGRSGRAIGQVFEYCGEALSSLTTDERVPLTNMVAETVRIDIAYGGSCAGGKREDLLHYHAVLHWAAQRGLRVAAGTRFFLQFGSQDVRDYCLQRGMFDAFER